MVSQMHKSVNKRQLSTRIILLFIDLFFETSKNRSRNELLLNWNINNFFSSIVIFVILTLFITVSDINFVGIGNFTAISNTLGFAPNELYVLDCLLNYAWRRFGGLCLQATHPIAGGRCLGHLKCNEKVNSWKISVKIVCVLLTI